MAFSRKIRLKIRKRASGVSEISGRGDLPLHAAHLDHNRKKRKYNEPVNGVYLTIVEHLKDHIFREGQNGLSIADNQAAIASLTKQVVNLKGERVVWEIYDQLEQPGAVEEWIATINVVTRCKA